MPEAADRYYRPSSSAPISGIFTMLTVGGLAALVMGTTYALVALYAPYAIFAVLGTVLIGLGGAMAVGYGATVGKVRNLAVVRGVTLIVGLFMVYVSWVVYIGLLTGVIFFSPQAIWQLIQAIAQRGVWDFGDLRPVGGELYALWLCEAAIICWPAISWASKSKRPFCESCRCWTEAIGLDVQVASEYRDEIVHALEAERYSALPGLQREPVHENDCIQFTSYQCPCCDDSCFLSAWRTITSPNEHGALETRTLDLFKHMRVPREIIDGLTALLEVAPTDDADDPIEDDYASAESDGVDD